MLKTLKDQSLRMNQKFQFSVVVFALITSLLTIVLSLYMARATIQIHKNLLQAEEERLHKLREILLFASRPEHKEHLSKTLDEYAANIQKDHDTMFNQLKRAEHSVMKQCFVFFVLIVMLLSLMRWEWRKKKFNVPKAEGTQAR